MSSVALIDTLKGKAAAYVMEKQWQAALDIYDEILDVASSVSDSKESVPPLLIATIFSNMSSCRLNMGDIELAVIDADSAIKLAPKWSKAHCRRALALMALERFDEAKVSMDMARVLEPNNKEFVALEARLAAARRGGGESGAVSGEAKPAVDAMKAPAGAILVEDHLKLTAVSMPLQLDPSQVFLPPALVKLGIPIAIAFRPQSERKGDNQLAAAFMIDLATGFAPARWTTGETGDVVVFRTDGGGITKIEVFALWDYFNIAIDAFKEGSPPDFTREHMLEWQESYNDMAQQCGEDDASLGEVHFVE
ncbi:Hypothetical protein, putative [Bodo saltans]|uniref:Uncharacterized protein n=1 Tax=Bodo saltans TaxID=75058 RepID=A0A0S4IUV9_BODSA|nr:Hypothetical protein, putative [Bodo saltans]|eukprot:CUG00085.1 Hypothetical protein, putative [Bodo saltans]